MKFQHISLLLFALLLSLASLSAAEPSNSQAKPNIILIIADDLGPGDLSCAGATKIKTPNIDRLAAEGVRFTQGYAPSATCTPSRYSLLTGEYAWRQKAKSNSILDGDAPLCIEPGRLTLPAMLRAANYQTGIVGKWHLGLGDGRTKVDFNNEVKPGPLEVGFDYCHIIPATVDRVPSVWIENHQVLGLDPADPIEVSYLAKIGDEPTGLERPDLLKQGADKQHSCTIINGTSRIGYMKGGIAARFKDEELASTVVAKSIEFIEQQKDKPFFLEVGLFEPHVPRVAEKPFVGSSGTGVRGDVIQQIDWEVGEILKALDRLQLANNTLVVFTSDNGPILFDGYYDRSVEDLNGHQPTSGLRGWKYLTFEGGCRVPFIARWPEHIQPRVSEQMISLVDCFATLAKIVDHEIAADAAMDSLDCQPRCWEIPIRTFVPKLCFTALAMRSRSARATGNIFPPPPKRVQVASAVVRTHPTLGLLPRTSPSQCCSISLPIQTSSATFSQCIPTRRASWLGNWNSSSPKAIQRNRLQQHAE
ncbi:MAG: sulfatase-like hydrolase/transferase [Planctomycetales bacterium]|nr:sulfatase-like hydrolase/transferase [Planctomycetales bacterium]